MSRMTVDFVGLGGKGFPIFKAERAGGCSLADVGPIINFFGVVSERFGDTIGYRVTYTEYSYCFDVSIFKV